MKVEFLFRFEHVPANVPPGIYQVQVFELGERVLGAAGRLRDGGSAETDEWMAEYWYSRAAAIFAGTNQIQKNIIAQRVLGLPR